MQTDDYLLIEIVTWKHKIVYKILKSKVFDRNTWYDWTVWKLFVLYRNTWYQLNSCAKNSKN